MVAPPPRPRRPETPHGEQHYFASDPTSPSQTRQLTLTLPDLTLPLTSDRGTFSADRVDAGTRYLLGELTAVPAGPAELLDLGCGYGPIALTLASRAPDARVWAVDVNRRALDLCRRNASDLGLRNVTCAQPDDVPSEVRFTQIWSNPPIRIGKAALHELLRHWLTRLAPDGLARLVVAKNLGADSLQRWLDASGWRATRVGSRAGYRLLEVRQDGPG